MAVEDDAPSQVATKELEINFSVLHMVGVSVAVKMAAQSLPLVDLICVLAMVVEGDVQWMDVKNLLNRLQNSVSNTVEGKNALNQTVQK